MWVLITLLLISWFGNSSPVEFNYTYVKFILTWPGTFCEDGQCNQQVFENWDHQSFTVHGLWPSSSDQGFEVTFRGGDMTLEDLPRDILEKLHKIMPGLSQRRSAEEFWEYEFEKHGGCYASLQKQSGVDRDAKELMIQYFRTIIKLYDRFPARFRLQRENYDGVHDLSQDLGLNSSSFRIKTKQQRLLEVSICLSPPEGESGGLRVTNCPEPSPNDENIHIPGLKTFRHSHLHSLHRPI